MVNKRITEKHKRLIYDLILNSSPEGVYQMVLNGEIDRFPRYFWSMPENYDWASKCTRYLIEKVLKWDRGQICANFCSSILTKYKLMGMSRAVFGVNIFKTLDNAYPNEFMPWELQKCSKGYFDNEENRIKAVKWLIEDKLKWTREQVCENLSVQTFKDNQLTTLMHRNYGGVFVLLNSAYPGEYQTVEIKQIKNLWGDLDTCNKVIRWLIEEKLKWNRDEVCRNFSNTLLKDNNLHGLLHRFNDSPYNMLNSAYPDEYMPWELSYGPKKIWDDTETVEKAIRWLVEDKLGYSKDSVNKVKSSDFTNNKLAYLVANKFDGYYKKALEFVYGNVE